MLGLQQPQILLNTCPFIYLNVKLKPQLDTQNFIDKTIKVENTEIGENEPIWPKKHNVI